MVHMSYFRRLQRTIKGRKSSEVNLWLCLYILYVCICVGVHAHVCTDMWRQRYVDLLDCFSTLFFEPEALTEPRACWLFRLAASQTLGLLPHQPAQCWDCRCVPHVHMCAKDLISGPQAYRAGIWLSHLPRPSMIYFDVSRKLWDSPPDSFLWYCCQHLK